jgi:hypothetical protein
LKAEEKKFEHFMVQKDSTILDEVDAVCIPNDGNKKYLHTFCLKISGKEKTLGA